jgi:hypothetical protein
LVKVTSIGMDEPNMLLEPSTEVLISIFWLFMFWVVMVTCAVLAWKLRLRVFMPEWLSWFVWLKLTGENGAKIMALTITADTKIAINTIAAITNGSFLSVLSGFAGATGANVTTGVPHFWQKCAESSSLVPHLRQNGNTETSSYTVLRLANLRLTKITFNLLISLNCNLPI